jgi:hypothetical protein
MNSSWEKNGGPMKKLYVRSCYISILDKILGHKTHVLLRGTPGIGKSAFMFYLVYYLAQRPCNVSICLTYLVKETSQSWYLLRKDGVVSIAASLEGNPDYYFSDSVDIEGAGTANELTMLFASIKDKHFKTFWKVKQTQRGSWGIFLPLVEPDELKHMVPAGTTYSDESLQFRFNIFGGSARNCLDAGNDAPPDVETQTQIRNALESFFGPTNSADISWAVGVLGQHVQKLLTGDAAEQLKRSVFQHVFVDSGSFGVTASSFCTKFMKYLCGRILQTKERGVQERIVALFGECGAGIMFEAMAFDTIIQQLQNGHVYRMLNLKTKRWSKLTTSATHFRKVLIRTTDDIQRLKVGDIGVPVVGNFPLVDFVIKPNILLQMTVAKKHSGAVNRLVDIQTKLGGKKDQHKMVFVTTAANVHEFQMCSDLEQISQFVMCPEVVAGDSVLGKRTA